MALTAQDLRDVEAAASAVRYALDCELFWNQAHGMLRRNGDSRTKVVLIIVGLALLMFAGKRLFEWSGVAEKIQSFF